jgi:hypothetical protein
MRIKCARCGKKFEPDQEWHFLCKEDVSGCWEEVGLFGDPEAIRFWRMASTWVNGEFPEEWVKELADSPVGQSLLKALLFQMDHDCKIKLLKKTIADLG